MDRKRSPNIHRELGVEEPDEAGQVASWEQISG